MFNQKERMVGNIKVGIVITLVSAILNFAFVVDLEYRNVVGGKIKILIPKNFTKVIVKPVADEGNIGPQMEFEQYCNKDTTEKIVFSKFDKADILGWAHFLKIGVLNQASKIYSSDIVTINGNKIYIAKCDFDNHAKSGYTDIFLINTGDKTIMGTIYCDKKLKSKWLPISEKILNSIKLN